MCGISGVLEGDKLALANVPLVRAVNAGLAHRGPDAEGVWKRGPCALGHRRLSIIDLSDNGRQPLTNADETLSLVVNGEIYNYRVLRDELRARGYTFRSDTDSEVILHGYAEWGPSVVARLDGMFAFALYDAKRGELFLARDRAGKKPLVYYREPGGSRRFVFASELRALTRALRSEGGGLPPIDYGAIDEYLTLQYVPGPRTVYQGISKLPPATYAIVKPGTEPVLTRYWSMPDGPARAATNEDLAQELRGLLHVAVKRRLMSDVPLGAFLSGGIDSGTVVALMASASTAPVKTFTIGFSPDDPELASARLVSERYKTDHHEAIVTPKMTDVLPKLVTHYGEPFADSSAVATYYLAEYTKKSVTVALSGDAGDELLGGYKRYAVARMGHVYDVLPEVAQAPVRRLATVLLGLGSHAYANYANRASEGEGRRYLELVRFLTEEDKNRLYRGRLLEARTRATVERFERLLGETRAAHRFGRLLRLDFSTYLPDDILTKVDIASMAHALEVRCPFLDTDVVEFCARLAPSALSRVRGKYILRRATEGLLPDAVRTRVKRGFALPLEQWMFHDLKPMLEDLLLAPDARIAGLVSQAGVRTLMKQNGVGSKAADKLWALLFLELWLRAE
ncbi:MAG: asparagine synthase (glutamine-hydrolyzing) [Polyangiaceae bacterium]